MGNQPSAPGCGECCESRTNGLEIQPGQVFAVRPQDEIDPVRKKLHGVGLVFRTTRDGKMVVSSFVKDSSAYECGQVRDGDILAAVEGQSVDSLPLDQIHGLLLGEKDSWVQMRFLRQTDNKMARNSNRFSAENGRLSTDFSDAPMLGQGVGDTRWASSKMRSFAPTYDTIVVDLCRMTPSSVLSEAATQAQEEAMSSRGRRTR
mmetsp:Transcript_14554/g.30137  ORF Transcript_14554/g.30137 Transcript_14554/m.30137 type:complete len:204 (+) Transcript_14554:139-750(+)